MDFHPSRGRTISAVIPTHNRAGLLPRALDSALAQRRRPDEVIVVDDGSTDETADVLARYGDAVRVIRKQQGGVSSARNLGVSQSRGELIAFLDSDDFWDEDHLMTMERAIDATDGGAALYFSDLRLSERRGGGTIWERSGFSIAARQEIALDALDWLLLPRQPMMIPASIVRRDMYLAVGGSETHLVCRGDTHLFFKLGLAGPLCAVAGVAGGATSDDQASITQAFAGYDETYATCTVALFSDVLERMGQPRPEQRRIVSRRLAAAHWELARARSLRTPWRVPAHLAAVVRHDPTIVTTRVRNRLLRQVGGSSVMARLRASAD